MEMFWNKILIFAIRITSILTTMHKKVLFLFFALMMGTAVQAQEIEKVDKFPSGYINGVYMGEAKYKTIDGVLYAVGYEGTKDWILVRYPAGSHNDS